MSRCFPYPPPGYCRDGGAAHDALIESIKLQKETGKAKAERKKEKKLKKQKKEKKKEEKEKRKNEEKLKSQKNQTQDAHKLLPKEAGITEGKKPSTEVLEKSDLTEEGGQPIKPSYSSDSTQNSNKRRRDENDNEDVLLHDDSAGHGKHIKIRLLKKLKESDPTTSGDDARLKTGSLPPPRRENNAAQRVPSTQTKSNGPSPSSSAKSILPPGSRKSDVEVLKSSRQQQLQQQQKHQQIASFSRPVVSGSPKHDIPSSSASRNIGVQGPNTARPGLLQNKPSLIATGKRPINEIPVPGNTSFQNKPSPITTGRRPGNEIPVAGNISFQNKPSLVTPGRRPVNETPVPGNISLQNKPSPITTGKRPINEIPVPGNISLNKPSPVTTGNRPVNETPVPGTSRPANLGWRKEDSEKPGPSRAEKKLMKKHAKYEKLVGSWVPPPVFQTLLPQVNDEDWLSRRTKPATSSVSKGEVDTCGAGEAGLWQPRARFLAEAGIHALPYTIPF